MGNFGMKHPHVVGVPKQGLINPKNPGKKVDIKKVGLYNYMAYVVVEIKTISFTGSAGKNTHEGGVKFHEKNVPAKG